MARILSLQTRLLAGLTALFIAAMTVLGFVLVDEARDRHARFDLEQARYQARTLAETSIGAVIGEDFELMERLVGAALPSRHYAYAALARLNGQVLTHTDHAFIGRRLDVQPGTEPSERLLRYNDRPVREVGYPVHAGRAHVAGAYVAYYLDEQQILAANAVYKIALTVVLLLIGLGVGALFVSRMIIDPVKMLTVAVSQTSLDNPNAEVLPQNLLARPDEVGQLAQSFGALTRRLRQAYDGLKRSHEQLEQRVEERTRELHEAGERIERDRAHLAAVMDNVAEGIVTLDDRGRIESLNRAAERLFGYSMAELLGKDTEMLVADASRPDHRQQVERYLTADADAPAGRGAWEVIAQRKEGTQFPAELVMSAMRAGPRRYFIGLVRDVTERKAVLDSLHHVANHDSLTGLYNRRYFVAELERWLALVRRGHHPPAALMFIDLDRFKEINDRFGHAAGDEVLIQVSRHLRERARGSDIVARMGGDEFAVLLHDVNPETALRVGESFQEQVSRFRYHRESEVAVIGCSIGIAMLGEHAGTIEEALAHADQACYEAKRAGRNAVRMFDAPGTPTPGASGKVVPIK
jgi:diguanylate cyclase (GGDEF)-like protein/PAS domain S-box-containing protein